MPTLHDEVAATLDAAVMTKEELDVKANVPAIVSWYTDDLTPIADGWVEMTDQQNPPMAAVSGVLAFDAGVVVFLADARMAVTPSGSAVADAILEGKPDALTEQMMSDCLVAIGYTRGGERIAITLPYTWDHESRTYHWRERIEVSGTTPTGKDERDLIHTIIAKAWADLKDRPAEVREMHARFAQDWLGPEALGMAKHVVDDPMSCLLSLRLTNGEAERILFRDGREPPSVN